ncbi:enoyl-CoA hydratase/isomerase family protein [Baekduia soli]|uniref:Enoyl-CoA hydratase/isomerase family protein n=1 Tax=Baekduia soli TaxID=496014 RepID=A0A5B8UA37_9ACTN|nr:enoyl-CoA hydratase/isomerase family protein [Baekduia soli]QEC49920.1 enoyl-CoA hydratase/isomerase family protein [Baekduia soli]
MSGEVVRLEHDGPLAVLTFDAPPLNLFDDAVFSGFRDAIATVAADPPRGLLIRAEGKVVSGGVDVGKVFDGMTAARGRALWDELLATIHVLEDLPLPTVFAAHGLCLTAAFEIALACDLLLAAPRARFGLVEIVVGLTPSMGGPQRLAERAGPARAKELIYSGELFDAPTLERWNVVNRVLDGEDFDAQARAFAARIAAGPTRAHAATKAIVAEQTERGVRAADAIVGEVSGALFDTEDLRNAVRSFLTDGPGQATYEGR